MKNKNSPRLFFLPGWGFSANMWTRINKTISKREHISQFVELSEALMFHPFPEDSILIGWSLGGLVAIKQLLLYPKHYKKLILINSTSYFSKFTLHYKNNAKSNFLNFKELFLRWVFYPYRSDKIPSWKNYCFIERKTALMEQLMFLFNNDLREEYLESVDLPVLFINGNRDSIISHDDQSYKKNDLVKILRGGHALPFTHHAEIAKIIENFL